MAEFDRLESKSVRIRFCIENMGNALQNLITNSCHQNTEFLSDLKFRHGKIRAGTEDNPVNFNRTLLNKLSLELILDYQICIYDLMIYLQLSDEEKELVTWVHDNKLRFTESQLMSSLFIDYFMIYCRNKHLPDPNEDYPNFITTAFGKAILKREEVQNILTSNDLNKMDKTWIKELEMKNFPDVVKSRLIKSISGCRLFNVICKFEPDIPNWDKDDQSKLLVESIRELVSRGPYWEFHSEFQPLSLKSIPINANISNLLLDIYTPGALSHIKEIGALYSMPKRSKHAQEYRKWSKEFFNQYATRIVFD